MKTRMERYVDTQEEMVRTQKNQNLYEDIYNSLPSSSVAVIDNESEIDLSKIKELSESREGYKRVRQYQSMLNPSALEDEPEEYDIYEDIDNKIYDINMILEDARTKRETSEIDKYRSLNNTQYDILSKLNLNEEPEKEEMVTDFFTKDQSIKDLVDTAEEDEENKKSSELIKTSADLFADLRGEDNTILTDAVQNEVDDSTIHNTSEVNTFYTNHLHFTENDFDGFQELQTSVKKGTGFIKVLISILVIVLLALVVFLGFIIF